MYQKLVNLARQNANFEAKNVHVSILTHKNKVISIGRNDYNKTSSAFVDFYRETHNRIHSEMDCIKRARNYRHLSKCTLWNFRFARRNNEFLLSMPCKGCMKLINLFEIKKVMFTTPYGMSEL